MGYKADCKKALTPGSEIKFYFGELEFEGTVLSYDNKNSGDYSAVVEMEKDERMILPISSNNILIRFKPSKELLEQEKEATKVDKNEKPGLVPK